MSAHNKAYQNSLQSSFCRSSLNLKHEPNVKTLLIDIKMMASPMRLTVTFCSVKVTIIVRQSKSIEEREIGKQFAPFWRESADQLKVLFPDRDDESAFIIPELYRRSHVLSIKDRRNGVVKPVFKFAPLGSGHTFALVTTELSVLAVSLEVLQRVLSSEQGQCVMAALSPLRFFSAPGGSKRPFPRFPFSVGSALCVIFDSRRRFCMIQHLAPGKILLMFVGAHARHFLAFSFLPCGFGATNP